MAELRQCRKLAPCCQRADKSQGQRHGKAIISTQPDGSYSVILKLQAANNNPANYEIEIAYYGENAPSMTGVAVLLHSERRAPFK